MDKHYDEKMELMVELATLYGKKYPPNVFDRMVDALDDTPLADLKSGIKHLIKNLKFMPSVAEMREAADVHCAPIRNEAKRTWTSEEADRYIEEVDSYADDDV